MVKKKFVCEGEGVTVVVEAGSWMEALKTVATSRNLTSFTELLDKGWSTCPQDANDETKVVLDALRGK